MLSLAIGAGLFLAYASQAGADTSFGITTSPSLYPSFSPGVTDYVTRCVAGQPLQVSITAPSGSETSIDGGPARGGTFVTDVAVSTGQEITVTNQGSSYYVRCLPPDFPQWTTEVTGNPQAQWYLTTEIFDTTSYIVLFDDNGVPVWWIKGSSAVYAGLLPDGNIAYTNLDYGPIQEIALTGTLVRSISAVGGSTDLHEIQQLSNGNYLLIADHTQPNVDLTPIGGPSDGSLVDPVIEEIDQNGNLVWSWDTYQHIPLTETDPQWYSAALTASPADPYHMNSLEVDGSTLLVSFRHLDAVYDIDMGSGNILWKLGDSQGSAPDTLTVDGDPVFSNGSHFGGQHDARVLPNGDITVYDDGSNLGRPSRAAEYSINTTTQTATLVNTVSDPDGSTSACCGSARRLPGGDWVVSWATTPNFQELTSGGSPVITFSWSTPGKFSYRVVPILPGTLSAPTLRADMNAQYPPPTPPSSPRSALTLAASDGGAFALGSANYYGSMGGQPLNAPVVGIARTWDGRGYWQVASDGGIFAFGDAGFYGSMGGQPLNSPVVGIAQTADGQGYWEVAADGGVFAFGDAGFYGSMGGQPLNSPIIAMARSAGGQGYWLVAADGGVFAFGDAGFYGSMGGQPLNSPVVGIARTTSGQGYTLVAGDGGIFTFGDSGYYGSMGGQPLNSPVVSLTRTSDGQGYWLVAADGGVFAFGDAPFLGSLPAEGVVTTSVVSSSPG